MFGAFLTWLHVSDYRSLWSTKRWKSLNRKFSIEQLFQLQKRRPKLRQRFIKNYWF